LVIEAKDSCTIQTPAILKLFESASVVSGRVDAPPVPTEYSVPVEAVAVAGQRLLPFSGRMTALFIAVLSSLWATAPPVPTEFLVRTGVREGEC
jgi:hypothetical protein